MRWDEFERAAPDFAEAGLRLFATAQDEGVLIAYMATVSANGTPRIAPVCPIHAGGELFISAGTTTPKVRDLQERGRYALHAFLGAGDEEFQIWGQATRIGDDGARARVHAAIRFQFDAEDPVFALDVKRCRWGYWVNPGRPGTYPVHKRWP